MIDARRYGDAGLANGRQPSVASKGMVSSPHPFATLVGLDVLRAGGNAVDAALAVSASLMVAAPHQCGPGGDAWWLIQTPGEDPVVLNASGEAGSTADAAALRRRGHGSIPLDAAEAVTVPGAIAGWAEAHSRFATLDLPSLVGPAVRAAAEGLPVTPYLARRLAIADQLLASRPESDATYRPHGRPLQTGELLVLSALAETLGQVARDPRSLYDGDLGATIAATIENAGGFVAREDLAKATAMWDVPVAGELSGVRVWEAPPNSQGLTALIAIGIAQRLGLEDASAQPAARQHIWIEAARAALVVRDFVIGDPRDMPVTPAALLDPACLDPLAALVGGRATPEPQLRLGIARVLMERGPAQPGRRPVTQDGDTVHFAIVDHDRLAVSCIQSLFTNFGTGIAVPGTGIVLQNRGSGFTLEENHPNQLRPGRRPLHTLTPGIATASGHVAAVFGAMGGHAQTQLHLQMLDGLVIERLDPAAVTDHPRWFARVDERGEAEVLMEARSDTAVGLRERGHNVRLVGPYDELMGHEQIIAIDHGRGVLVGAADPRTDGLVLGH